MIISHISLLLRSLFRILNHKIPKWNDHISPTSKKNPGRNKKSQPHNSHNFVIIPVFSVTLPFFVEIFFFFWWPSSPPLLSNPCPPIVPTPLLDDEIMLGIGFEALNLRGSHLTDTTNGAGRRLTSTVENVREKSGSVLFVFCWGFFWRKKGEDSGAIILGDVTMYIHTCYHLSISNNPFVYVYKCVRNPQFKQIPFSTTFRKGHSDTPKNLDPRSRGGAMRCPNIDLHLQLVHWMLLSSNETAPYLA